MEEPTLNTPFLTHYNQNPSPKTPQNSHFSLKFNNQTFENTDFNQNPHEKNPQNHEYVIIKDQNFEKYQNPHEKTPQNHDFDTIKDQNFENFENPDEKNPQNHIPFIIKDQIFEKIENPHEKNHENHVFLTNKDQIFEKIENPHEKTPQKDKIFEKIENPDENFTENHVSFLIKDQIFEKNENPDENFPENHISVIIKDQIFEKNENPYEFIGIFDGFCVPSSSTADPFRNHTVKINGVYEWFKIIICIPIVIIRGILFGLSLLIGYFATLIALHGWKDKHNPMPKWRCNLMWVTRFCARIILFSFGYQWIRRKGRPAPREVAPIVVSNHVSYIDPIFFFYELFPTIVASDSHDSMPFVGTIIRAMQVIYVNRFSPSSRKNAVNEIKRKAASKRFPRVLLFPEGTTTNGRFLLSFQMGAFIPGQPIQPVVVRYPYVHFDQSWGNISLARLMFRMFTQFHNFMEVEYLPVVRPLQIHKESASVFAERTAHAMASALNVLQTSYTYGDMMLMMKAVELRQENPSRYMVELGHVNSSYRINTMESLEFLEKFVSMNPDSSGYVKIEDFLKVLRLKPCDLSEKIFAFVDIEKMGKINFKQFLLASNHIMKQPLFQRACEFSFSKCSIGMHIYEKEFGDAIRLAIPDVDDHEVNGLFKLFDMDGDGKIRKHEFLSCLRKNPLLIALFSSLLQDEFANFSNGPLEEMV